MRVTNDVAMAQVGARVFLNIGVGLLGPTSLYLAMLATDYIKPLRGTSLFVLIYLVPIWSIVIRAGTNWIQTGVKEYYWGYSDSLEGPLGSIYYIFSASYFFVALAILAYRYSTSTGKTKQISLLMFVGLIIPLFMTISTDVILPSVGGHILELAVPACVVYLVALYVALKKYELFEIKPVSEKKIKVEGKSIANDNGVVKDLAGGKIYYFDETKPMVAINVFTSLVSHGRQGLGIIRLSPQKFREQTGLEKTPLVWISSQDDPGVKSINPSAISRVYSTVAEFLKSAQRPVILLEGIEALIFTNNFREIMGLISSVYEKISVSDGVMIVPISRPTMNETEWTLLTRHMEDLAQVKAGPNKA
jgi:hypothetical protein